MKKKTQEKKDWRDPRQHDVYKQGNDSEIEKVYQVAGRL